MEMIVRKDTKRKVLEGKTTEFTLRGQLVDPQKISRYKKRKNLSEEILISAPSPAAGGYYFIICLHSSNSQEFRHTIRYRLFYTFRRRSSNSRFNIWRTNRQPEPSRFCAFTSQLRTCVHIHKPKPSFIPRLASLTWVAQALL